MGNIVGSSKSVKATLKKAALLARSSEKRYKLQSATILEQLLHRGDLPSVTELNPLFEALDSLTRRGCHSLFCFRRFGQLRGDHPEFSA